MKKILTHLTGIVLLITMLIVVGFKPATTDDDPPNWTEYPEKVTIYLKAYEEGGEMKLKLFDSRNETPVLAKDHIAYVGPETKVVWRRAEDSNIKSIKKVSPKVESGAIFPGEAKTILLNKRRRIRVLEDAPVPKVDENEPSETYEIIFKDKIYNKEWKIDPYLRIPRLEN